MSVLLKLHNKRILHCLTRLVVTSSNANGNRSSSKRCWSSDISKDGKNQFKNLNRKMSWMPKSFIDVCSKFTKYYEQILERKFPRTYKVYTVFVIGGRNFFLEMKEYLRIARDVRRGKKVNDLNRKEMEIYYEMPKDMYRIVPILMVATLPFTNYFIFPLAYFFPRQLLSTHFWSIEQRVEFALIFHKKRLYNNRPVFRHLQAKMRDIPNDQLQDKCNKMFHKIGSGVHPSVEEILSVKEVFSKKQPYHLTLLCAGHITSLCRLHGLPFWGLRVKRLQNYVLMMRDLDFALKRDDVRQLNVEDMRKACFARGLNPVGMARDSIVQYLEQWMTITEHVTKENCSLLLHCPILLAYNHPTNWSLIH